MQGGWGQGQGQQGQQGQPFQQGKPIQQGQPMQNRNLMPNQGGQRPMGQGSQGLQNFDFNKIA